MFTKSTTRSRGPLLALMVSLTWGGIAHGWQDPEERATPTVAPANPSAVTPAASVQKRSNPSGIFNDVLYINWGVIHAFAADAAVGHTWDPPVDYYGPFGNLCNPTWVPNQSGPCPAMGMVVQGCKLFVANTNGNSFVSLASPITVRGDVMLFDRISGRSKAKLVRPTDAQGNFNPDALGNPRGVLLWRDKLLVADLHGYDVNQPNADCTGDPTHPCLPGSINVYDPATGQLLDRWEPDATFTQFADFHPRGMVIGPDGLLYVAARNLPNGDPNFNSGLGGWVLRFNPHTGKYLGALVDSGTCNCDLNRPEGIVFGPGNDHRIFVASFRADPDDNDKILVFAKNGKYLSAIPLSEPVSAGGKRAYAQGILFGPHGYLYVPISGSDPEYTGEVRRYSVNTTPAKLVDVMVPAYAKGGPLQGSFYLTFGKTDPATLHYKPWLK